MGKEYVYTDVNRNVNKRKITKRLERIKQTGYASKSEKAFFDEINGKNKSNQVNTQLINL